MPGLIPSFDTIIPMTDHRICVRHLYANFRDNGFRGLALKELLWNAASSYTEVDFRIHMEEIKRSSDRQGPSCRPLPGPFLRGTGHFSFNIFFFKKN
jgi:hypothetical protein